MYCQWQCDVDDSQDQLINTQYVKQTFTTVLFITFTSFIAKGTTYHAVS